MEPIMGVLAIAELILVYVLSRQSIKKLFQILRLVFRNDAIVFRIIALIFLPGTILHELSHFIVATLLLLKVRDIHIFPRWQGNQIKLGSVAYEKRDVIRSILVGLAPVGAGLLFFWWLSTIPILQSGNISLQIVTVYVIFIVSTSMFSSRQDLIDIVYVIPFIIIIAGIVYIFDLPMITWVQTPFILAAISHFVYALNIYLLISIIIHVFLIESISILLFILQKK